MANSIFILFFTVAISATFALPQGNTKPKNQLESAAVVLPAQLDEDNSGAVITKPSNGTNAETKPVFQRPGSAIFKPDFAALCNLTCVSGRGQGVAKKSGACPVDGEAYRPRIGRSAKHDENGFGILGKCDEDEVERTSTICLFCLDSVNIVSNAHEAVYHIPCNQESREPQFQNATCAA